MRGSEEEDDEFSGTASARIWIVRGWMRAAAAAAAAASLSSSSPSSSSSLPADDFGEPNKRERQAGSCPAMVAL